MQSHKNVLGLYALLERLTGAFPDILFESCSGGGGRFDPGMLYYMPQTWTSDNTRIRGRYEIQYGTSVVYPASAICAHIAKINPHADKWDKEINTSALLAMGGELGFEPVSYTHLDVYKRQAMMMLIWYYPEKTEKALSLTDMTTLS